MLPDFPSLKDDLNKFLIEFFQGRVEFHLGYLSKIPRYSVFEGPRQGDQGQQLTRSTGETETFGLKYMSVDFEIPIEELGSLTLGRFLQKLDELALEFASKAEKFTFARVSEIIEKTGNTVDARGRKISADLLLELISTVQIDFNPDGTMDWPTLHVAQHMNEAADMAIMNLLTDKHYRKELEEVLTLKKEDWRDREARRKLVG